MHDFDWDDLRLVLEISRAGSLARGAERLGYDQSTVGRRLTKIEADLGATLFMRSRKGLMPTDAGQIAIRRATDIERRMDMLAEGVLESGKGLAGDVEIYGNPWLLDRLTAKIAPKLLIENDKINLRINGTGQPHSDTSGAAIGLFIEAKPKPPGLSCDSARCPTGSIEPNTRRRWSPFHGLPFTPRARPAPAIFQS
ncbi:MAG: LysR family transcriptional regulator [Pseudomonadota bacterium]